MIPQKSIIKALGISGNVVKNQVNVDNILPRNPGLQHV